MIRFWFFICFLTLLLCNNVFAQQEGKVEVFMDPKIDSLIARRLELTKKGNTTTSGKGFRVQIYAGDNRQKTYAEQIKFKSLFPNVSSYISYAQPNYKIRVGDFPNRLEAEKFMNQLRQYYPSLFIFSEPINIR